MHTTQEALAATHYRARPQDESKLRQLDILGAALGAIMMLGVQKDERPLKRASRETVALLA